MRRTLSLAASLAIVGTALVGCGSNEPTAGEATPEQMQIIQKNEPAPTGPSPLAKKVRAEGAANSFGAQ